MARRMGDLGRLEFSPGGETWLEFGPVGDRRRIGFHDYAAIYAVPGLYEHVFYDTLGMRSTARSCGCTDRCWTSSDWTRRTSG